ncbi:protein-export membrane protein SecF [Gloeothece citriformis PCC 7424]|uniref:Protein-export membrane protein SecF n=1 Tax=Gloeothece citriformis (strain PCC 7424) TaxID=65393 RepID=B7KJN2_GLOC7|nr:protein translocase subunit SecF [Gloeothece citriformis]ACK69481.1 protein-export membrane protein SecF [Gloeothece citriformis PCC 7424]
MKLNVTKRRGLWWSISGAAMLISLMAMIVSFAIIKTPLRPSIDFVGGTRIQLALDCSIPNNCQQPISTSSVQEILTEQELGNSSVQVIDQYTLSIRTQDLNVEQRTQLQTALNEKIGTFDPETIQIDTVGPTVGQELFTAGILALLVSFFGIIVYLSFRFQFDYALVAILALFHDAFITAGVFAILGLVLGVEVDSLFLVGLLTIIGFSVNDTVIIYDRMREVSTQKPELSINEVADQAVDQTLTRSVNTTLTTLLPLLSIFLFGGTTLKYFALTLIIGFILGAYSSIFVASPLVAWWRERQNKTPVANSQI